MPVREASVEPSRGVGWAQPHAGILPGRQSPRQRKKSAGTSCSRAATTVGISKGEVIDLTQNFTLSFVSLHCSNHRWKYASSRASRARLQVHPECSEGFNGHAPEP